jgi:hypothetical protein
LWRIHLPPNAPLAPDVDLAKLAGRFAFAGGNIKNVCFKAASRAALRLDNARITMDDRTPLPPHHYPLVLTIAFSFPSFFVSFRSSCAVEDCAQKELEKGGGGKENPAMIYS